MDQVSGPESVKKPRWSADNNTANSTVSLSNPSTAARSSNAFENYGYGSNSFNHQNMLAQQQLYATPINTNVSAVNGPGTAQISPNPASAFPQQQASNGNPPPSPFITNGNTAAYGLANFGYGLNGMMGVPGMGMLGGFPYGAQVCISISSPL